ncbi:MAG: helix-turn-helix domain-containing protein [Chitinophagales bacterium]
MTESLYYIGIAQAMFVAFIMLTKKEKQGSDFVLIIWLLTIAFKLLVRLTSIEHGDFFDDQFAISLIPLTFGPFLFLYTKYLMYHRFFFTSKDYLHFVPFVVFTVLYFLFFAGKLSFEAGDLLQTDGYVIPRLIYGSAFLISVFYYGFLTLYILNRYRKSWLNRFSTDSAKSKLNWLYFLSFFFIASYIIYTLLGICNIVAENNNFDILYISDICLTMLIFSISYFGITQPHLYSVVPDDEEKTVAEEKETDDLNQKEKYQNSTLSEDVKTTYIDQIFAYMQSEKPYLNPELTVQDLSKQLNISRHHLTEILNNDLGKNFFTFINEYRVNEVKRRLLDEKFSHLTIVAIAFDSGFNSKSTFNSIFKQQTELTPSKWKKENSL